MDRNRSIWADLVYVIAAAAFVFVVAHWDGLTNPYVINDDVRQQVYWMQSWLDPELYQDDLLTRYAKNYVPWGVQAIYHAAALGVEPLYFSKILTGILFVATACLFFALGLELKDRMTAVLVACVYFLFGGFLHQISGGLSRAFVYPLLAAHLLFLSRGMLVAASAAIVLESVLNPYVFLLSLCTQGLFMVHNYGRGLLTLLSNLLSLRPSRSGSDMLSPEPLLPISPSKLMVSCGLAAIGGTLAASKYVILRSSEFGSLVSRAQMASGSEYASAGRYEIFPLPSFWLELIRPLVPWPETSHLSIVAGCALFALMIVSTAWALTRKNRRVDPRRLRIFVYLLISSVVLYFAADLILMKLFLPRRYLEFSLSLFYCLLIAVAVRTAVEHFGFERLLFPFLVTGLVLVGAVRLHGVALYDYSKDAELYQFLLTTPKSALVAGHPEVMDNVPTFGRRKAFVTYELSHSWYDRFWDVIKKRTLDFFDAYYSEDPEQIRRFGRDNGVSYIVVRDADFSPENLRSKSVYFEPFGDYIRKLTAHRNYYAIRDSKQFPPVFRNKTMRVVKLY